MFFLGCVFLSMASYAIGLMTRELYEAWIERGEEDECDTCEESLGYYDEESDEDECYNY